MTLDAAPWSAAEVITGYERGFAERAAVWLSIPVYVPLLKAAVWARHVRRWRESLRPMLPGYVLIQAPTELTDGDLRSAWPPAWARILRRPDGLPAHLATGELARLRALEASGAADRDPRDFALKFVVGAGYVVRQGLWTGFELTCVRSPRRGAASGEFENCGGKITLPLYLFADPV